MDVFHIEKPLFYGRAVKFDFFQSYATKEDVLPNSCDAVWNANRLKSRTIIESIVTNTSHTAWDINGLEIQTSIKSVIHYTGHTFR